MRVLRKSNAVFASTLLLLLASCVTSSYRILGHDSYLTELEVTPDRILLECEDIKDHENAGDPEGNFGFLIHVLDEENTVLNLIQEPVTNRKYCFKRLDDIAKILKKGKRIYIGAHGSLEKPRKKNERTYSFRRVGTFSGNSRVLQFSVIKNEFEDCYSANNATKYPCMPDELPIKKSP